MEVCTVIVAQLRLTLRPHEPTPRSTEWSRQESWSGQPFPSPGDRPNPEIKPGSPALQVDSLPAELLLGLQILKLQNTHILQ